MKHTNTVRLTPQIHSFLIQAVIRGHLKLDQLGQMVGHELVNKPKRRKLRRRISK